MKYLKGFPLHMW